MKPPLLELSSISLSLPVRGSDRPTTILRDVNLTIGHGEIVGLVGESGSGKSMTARTVVSSLPFAAQVSGSVVLNGTDLRSLPPKKMRAVRANDIGMIFQDPRSSVDPLWTIEDHLTEGMRVHDGLSKQDARARAIELLAKVGIRDGERRLAQYPHELSGGLLQRVVIAGALAGDPQLVIADEPTTALDVTSQAEIVGIFSELRRDRDVGMLFVTHDLALATSLCDRIIVMYAGRVLEVNEHDGIFTHPSHPYTAALVRARPSMDVRADSLEVIPGRPASANATLVGCPFAPRCVHRADTCDSAPMTLAPWGEGETACVRIHELSGVLNV